VKVHGIWRIKTLHWYQDFLVPYQGGWQVNPDDNGGIWASNVLAPDGPTSVPYQTWPNTFLPPFHFPNPVLGASPVDYSTVIPEPMERPSLRALAKRTAILEHEAQLIQDEQDSVWLSL
jgi:hypothetical protein